MNTLLFHFLNLDVNDKYNCFHHIFDNLKKLKFKIPKTKQRHPTLKKALKMKKVLKIYEKLM